MPEIFLQMDIQLHFMLIMKNSLLFANYIIQNEVEDFTQERIIIQMNMVQSIILCKKF